MKTWSTSFRFSFLLLALVTLASLFVCACLHAADYPKLYQQAKKENDPKKVESLLAEWRSQTPPDPEAWIASANYHFSQSEKVEVTTKKPEGDDIEVREQKTGKVAGSIAFSRDAARMKTAIGYLEEAVGLFPQRADIRLGLCYLLEANEDFEGLLQAFRQWVAYAKAHPDALQGKNGVPLKQPSAVFLPQKINGYVVDYFKKRTREDDARAERLALFSSENYPNHPYAWNVLAACYGRKNDLPKAREYLEKAYAADPNDTLVLLNLGDACRSLGDTQTAQKYYQKVVDLKPDAETLKDAQAALQALEKQPNR